MSAVVAAVGAPLNPQTRAWVAQATTLSCFAGPDGDAVHIEPRFGLGHVWLRTSPTEVAQPITLDGRTWLTADVRFDDRAGVIAGLRARRRDVSDRLSDAELLLHAYAVWDERCLEHLAGDFSFALWDGPRQRLVCARDQLGTTPLHYARTADGLLVATSIDALLLHPAVSDRLDETALADFLITGCYRDFGATAFEGIRRVPPAHALTWSDGHFRLSRYWRLPRWEPLVRFPQPQDYAERFGELLDAAVADRITTDRLAVQLSGGMDSTSIAASARVTLHRRGAPPDALRAVTAVLGGTSGDREGDFAALVAQALELEVDWIDGSTMTPDDPAAAPSLLTPEPTPYRRTPFEYEVARRPASHAPVALSGIGGDALLWFGPWYWVEWIAHGQVLRLTRAFADQLRLSGARLHPHLRAGLARPWSRPAGRDRPLPGWLDPEFAARTGALQLHPGLIPAASTLDVRSLVNGPLWSTDCTRGDPSFTRLPVRFRYPFLDLRLLRFASALPPEPWLINKRILRDATADRLPPEIRGRPKAPLVRAPLPGHTTEVMKQLASFVRHANGLERFIDRDALTAALSKQGAEVAPESDRELARALGLAHWLVHWSRPRRHDLGAPGAQPRV